MFLGVSKLNLDTKGRMAIPAKYREALVECCASQVVVTINPSEHCLWLYPDDEWQKIAYKLTRLPTLKKQNRIMQRLLLGHAAELEMDGQGRILLPAELREYAQMDKKVQLVGEGHKFEIWAEESWMGGRSDWMNEAEALMNDLPEDLSEMVF